MKDPSALKAAHLRGSLPGEALGSRGLEHAARNPACKRLRALTILSVSPASAADKVYNRPAREGQSPFALGVGSRFEGRLFENGAARLLELYRTAGVLSPREAKVVIIPDLAPGTRPQDIARRLAETQRLLHIKSRADPAAPNLIIKPLLPVTFIGRHLVEPDALRGSDGDRFYRPVEVKSYPNRGGKTSSEDLRNAFRQAAVAVVALRQILQAASVPDPASVARATADIVLRKPGRMNATLNVDESIRAEVFGIAKAVEEAPRDLEELEAMLPPGALLDDPAVLNTIPNFYRPSCREFCALAAVCKEEAVRDGDPVLLGDVAREELAAVGSIPRALELLAGRAAPRNSEEQLVQERLAKAADALEKAVKNGGI